MKWNVSGKLDPVDDSLTLALCVSAPIKGFFNQPIKMMVIVLYFLMLLILLVLFLKEVISLTLSRAAERRSGHVQGNFVNTFTLPEDFEFKILASIC